MTTRTAVSVLVLAALVFLSTVARTSAQITNQVAVSGFSYTFSSTAGNNPTIGLFRGVTYVFSLNAIGHPFYIKSNISSGTGGQYTDGVVNNGATSGFLTFAVPQTAPSTLYYNCSAHSDIGMFGTFNISDSPTPPTGEIVLISITETGVTMQSLGTNGWRAIPEFSSNLVTGTWAPVATYTNVLANNTNTTTFNRLDPICGPNVFLRIRNQFP
jgi:hypothetical protein